MSRTIADVRYPWLDEALKGGGVVITANRRLARELTEAWGQMQLAAGKTTWVTPEIHSWQGWLAGLIGSARDPSLLPRRLDAAGAGILWERCLTNRMPDGVLGINGIVRQANMSWSRMHEWDIGVPALLSTAASQDEKLFARAAADYRDQLDAGNWVDGPGLGHCVAEAIDQGLIHLPPKLTAAGFDQLSPLVAKVLTATAGQNCDVSILAAADPSNPPIVTDFDTLDAELRAAGAWARRTLESTPNARIGIVYAGLESAAQQVTRCIREGLLPGSQFAKGQNQTLAEVSYGRRLSEYPAVTAALALLRWIGNGLTGPELSPLIMSPFFRAGAAGASARMELRLREYPDRHWTVGGFLETFQAAAGDATDDSFLEIAEIVRQAADRVGTPLPPSECIRMIDKLLDDCGWPGDQTLDSQAFQLINRWRELLNEFARVESIVPSLDFSEAVRRIKGLATDTIWQPEVDAGVVQVLGPLEAAGITFDAIWVAGMDASHWPPPSRPAPFIAIELQRQRKMPDATPGDTLAYARRTLGRLIGSAPICVLSWSRAQDDAEQVRSTLLDEFETSDEDDFADPGWYASSLCGQAAIETIENDRIRPVTKEERVWGGAYTVQRQYQEPFAAMVIGRFGVRRPEPFVTGLSPGVRGNIIHNALHILLNDKPSVREISQWSDDEVSRRAGAAIDGALATHSRHADPVLSRLIGFERERVRSLLIRFVTSEQARDPDIQVVAAELPLSYELDDVKLSFRIDRVDRLPDDRLLIIDYKTGAPKHFLRQTDELRDLQPVLYADAVDGSVGGLAFLNVDSRAITWKSAISDNNDEDDSFDDRLAGWIRVVRECVKAFAAGDTRINVMLNSAEARPLAILSRIEEIRRDQ